MFLLHIYSNNFFLSGSKVTIVTCIFCQLWEGTMIVCHKFTQLVLGTRLKIPFFASILLKIVLAPCMVLMSKLVLSSDPNYHSLQLCFTQIDLKQTKLDNSKIKLALGYQLKITSSSKNFIGIIFCLLMFFCYMFFKNFPQIPCEIPINTSMVFLKIASAPCMVLMCSLSLGLSSGSNSHLLQFVTI